MVSDWDYRFYDLACEVSTWSKDPSTKVGAVIVDNSQRIVSTGYNGFPKGIADDDRLLDRELKNEMIIHGEMNAILFAHRDLTGCTIYTTPLLPCSRCAVIVIQSGIKRVVSPRVIPVRWRESCARSIKMFAEAGVVVDLLY